MNLMCLIVFSFMSSFYFWWMVRLMVFNPFQILSFFMVVAGSLYSLGGVSVLGVWLGMELNLFFFMGLMSVDGWYNVEACVKYFVVQSLGSQAFLFGYFLYNIEFSLGWVGVLSYLLMVSGILLKGGVFPFHSWVVSVVGLSGWIVCGLLMSWQKLVPFMVFGGVVSNSVLCVCVAGMSLIGGVGGLNQHSVKSMLVYSSFVHSAWMFLCLLFSSLFFLSYFVVYSIILVLLVLNLTHVESLGMKARGGSFNVSFFLLMLSGLPPFLFFFLKIVVMVLVSTPIVFVSVAGSLISFKYYWSFFYSFIFDAGHSVDLFSFWVLLAVNIVSFCGFFLFLL